MIGKCSSIAASLLWTRFSTIETGPLQSGVVGEIYASAEGMSI